jgi:hypothetical protein
MPPCPLAPLPLRPLAPLPPCPLAPLPPRPFTPSPPRPLAPSKTICTRGSCLPSLLCCNLLDAVRCWRSQIAAGRGATVPGRGATVPGRGATQLRGKEPQRRGKESKRRGVENRKNHYHLSPKNPGRLALPTVLLRLHALSPRQVHSDNHNLCMKVVLDALLPRI